MKKKRKSTRNLVVLFALIVVACVIPDGCTTAEAMPSPTVSQSTTTQEVVKPSPISFGSDLQISVDAPKAYSKRSVEPLRLEALANTLEAEANRLDELDKPTANELRAMATRMKKQHDRYLKSLSQEERNEYSDYLKTVDR